MVVFFDAPITNGQTLFPLPFSYTIGANELQVFLSGQLLATPDDYAETSVTSITTTFPLISTDRLIVRKLGAATSLSLNDLLDVTTVGVADGDFLVYNDTLGTWEPSAADPMLDQGSITSANIDRGRISVSFVSSGQESGLTDLVFEVRDPTNTQVAAAIPLAEYFTTAAYSGTVDVGMTSPGAHFVQVTSTSTPANNAFKIFEVSVAQTQGGTAMVQEATRTFGDTFTFRHIAESSLSDVLITIYDAADIPLLTSQPMVEIGSTGVFKLAFNPASAGLYTGIMSSVTANSTSVTEVIFTTDTPTSGSGSVVISNRVGVGRREDCD